MYRSISQSFLSMGLPRAVKDVIAKLFKLRTKTAVKYFLGLAFRCGPWFTTKVIDNYFELTKEQKKQVHQVTTEFIQWIKSYAIPEYTVVIESIKNEVIRRSFSNSNCDTLFDFLERVRGEVFGKVAEHSIAVLKTLGPDQIPKPIRFEKANKRLIHKLKSSEESRIRHRQEKIVDNFVEWFGDLTPKQNVLLYRHVRQFPDLTAFQLQFQMEFQKAFLELMRSPSRAELIEPTMRLWLTRQDQVRSLEFNAALQRRREAERALLIAALETVSDTQALHFDKEVSYIIGKLREKAVAPVAFVDNLPSDADFVQ